MPAVWPDRSELPDPNTADRAAYRAVRCLPGEIAPNVLVPGDPARAARIANEWLSDAKLVMVQREFHSYTGTYEGVPVSVISTGVGSPSAAMVMQDLGKLGCDVVIRVGTAGSCVKEVRPGDNVIGTAAVRDEGLTRKFIPEIYPAVANLEVTNALCAAGANQETDVHAGVVHTSDSFRSPALEKDIEISIYAGVLAFEMEAATVLTIAALNKIRAGCIFSIDGYVTHVAGGNVVPDVEARNQGIKSAIRSALDAIVSLAKK
ncbi:MAG: DeoD family purine-nucleoside phosphorylase [Woeseiaceae bacterium]|jgi:DeoD family purine-nucleoside phosphorylase